MPEQKLSFIPKKSFASSPVRSGGVGGLFFAITFFLLILSGIVYAGVFFYKGTLEGSKLRLKGELEKAINEFEPDLIQEINDTSKQLLALNTIMSKHTSIVPFFEFLEKNTTEKMKFNSFRHKIESDSIIVSMDGIAKSYASIAFQASVFEQTKQIKNVMFTGLSLNNNGDVSFRVEIAVDPEMFIYKIKQDQLNQNQ